MKQFLRHAGRFGERSSVERKAMAAFGDPIERIMVSFPTATATTRRACHLHTHRP